MDWSSLSAEEKEAFKDKARVFWNTNTYALRTKEVLGKSFVESSGFLEGSARAIFMLEEKGKCKQ